MRKANGKTLMMRDREFGLEEAEPRLRNKTSNQKF
jgi:hypothetical protein